MTVAGLLPWLAMGTMLALCAVYGILTVAGLSLPNDIDALRDIGSAQALLDGNWFGDPIYPEEWRFYPPLVPALRALLFRMVGATVLASHWVQTAPWLNLLPPLLFFFMARQLLGGAGPAAAALAAFLVLNGTMLGPPGLMEPWVTGGYTPWPFVPVTAQAFFFATVWLIHSRVGAGRWADALLIGAAIGVTFLAHVIPAVVLTGIVTLGAFAAQGFRLRTARWLVTVAAVQLTVMAPHFLPILISYPGGTVHPSYGWVADLFELSAPRIARTVLLNTPGIVAAILTWRMRHWAPMNRLTAATLAAWIAIPSIFVLRHYVCAITAQGASAPKACQVFVISVHHFYLYLQLAWPCLIGFVTWHTGHRITRKAHPAPVAAAIAVMCVAGAAVLLRDRGDVARRDILLLHHDTYLMDLAAYQWILAYTRPQDTFVTEHNERVGGGADVFTVIAAGRRLVSAPFFFSHPYVPREPREVRRLSYLAAASGDAPGLPCEGVRHGLYFLLTNTSKVDASRLEVVFRSPSRTVYRALPASCAR